jgi:hypothetical protein
MEKQCQFQRDWKFGMEKNNGIRKLLCLKDSGGDSKLVLTLSNSKTALMKRSS